MRCDGFTLIELMIVVSIIGILAAIAIPNFMKFQLRAKSGEGKTNISAIRVAEEGYMAEHGIYIRCSVTPVALATPPSKKQDFADTSGGAALDPPEGFNVIGWSPEGPVYFMYAVNIDANNPHYHVGAQADIDADGNMQAWGYARTLPDAAGNPQAGTTLPAADPTKCVMGGVQPPPLGGFLEYTVNQVGPCDTESGTSIF